MPFTPAHTVAVLPFVKRRGLSATALVVGSMSPDFEYFIRMKDVQGVWGHSLAGILLFDLPVTFLTCFLFHAVVKSAFIDNLPIFFQRRFAHLKTYSFQEDVIKRPFVFVSCACLGALTHVVWDWFTHAEGVFVRILPSLYENRYVLYKNVNYPMWYALQYISSIVGMAILGGYVLLVRPHNTYVTRPSGIYWLWLIAISGVVVYLRLQFSHQPSLPLYVISSITGLCIGVIILGLFPRRKEIGSS